ncbi:hypothetical protein FB464_3094 [Subtercola boreus]|uniref:DUF6527 family protein n=2 Tax=Subtercola boreus TaxID=120213 RepID=UPI0011745C77|nr:hypothetical protein FB464_3094 [Subtercola boreus]
MTEIDHYVASFVESFPAPMEPGVLYVSTNYSTAGHICPSGCGREVVTKLSPARWRVVFDGEVSLKPSVGATGLPCNSHYFITRGEVDWQDPLDAADAVKAQASDRRALTNYRVRTAPLPNRPSWWRRLWRRVG